MEKQIQAAIDKLGDTDSSKSDKLKKWLGYWKNLEAASCIPDSVMTNITGYIHGNLQCTNLCASLKGWFEQMYPGPNGGAVGEQLNESCNADCAEH